MKFASAVRVERPGRPQQVHEFVDHDGQQSAGIVRRLRGSESATVSLTTRHKDGHLLVAVSEYQAFIGLESRDGIFQYGRNSAAPTGTGEIPIEGQATELKARFIWSVEEAAAIVRAWIVDEDEPLGRWERQ